MSITTPSGLDFIPEQYRLYLDTLENLPSWARTVRSGYTGEMVPTVGQFSSFSRRTQQALLPQANRPNCICCGGDHGSH